MCPVTQDKQVAITLAGHTSEIHKKEIHFCIIRKFGINSPKILKQIVITDSNQR